MSLPRAEDLIRHYGLKPLLVEGGMYRQTWRSPHRVAHTGDGRLAPLGTATLALLTDDPDSFSAMHRLPTDEIWHFYLGDAIDLLLLHPGGGVERIVLGQEILAGERVQAIVPAGTWMGARVRPGGRYGLFGNTMAPGFTEADYEGGDETLAAAYPEAAETIRSLLRPGSPATMPDLGDG
jgi:uncharacterized protein